MASDGTGAGDSRAERGGRIPGSGGQAAFTATASSPSPIPVLIAVPHAGRAYTPELLESLRSPAAVALRLEDRQVDRLAEAVAVATGAPLLVAHAPRAMIDLNRAPDDIDWEMVAGDGGPRGADGRAAPGPGRRARSGLGLVPRRLPGVGELWRRRLDPSELDERIAQIHAPYHAAVAASLAAIRRRWGAALLLDLHSMPPLATRPGVPAAEFVLGDRFGASCDGGLVATAFACFARGRRPAAHNRPYAGGYALERHADPARAIHALQLEIDRRSYLDARLDHIGPGFTDLVEFVATLVRKLGAEVAVLGEAGGGRWPQAAE